MQRTVLVMGVCGVGKSTIAQALAERCGLNFVEADNFHSQENIDAMRAGRPLTDAMRWGWLDLVAQAASEAPSVIACSALKASYRKRLAAKLGAMKVIHLSGQKDLLAQRMAARQSHFMPLALLDSQFADLEPPAPGEALNLDVAAPLEEILTLAAIYIDQTRSGGSTAATTSIPGRNI